MHVVFVNPIDGSPRFKEYRHIGPYCVSHPLLDNRHADCSERLEIGYLEYVVCTCVCHYVAYEEA